MDSAALASLRENVRGTVITPDDEAYDEARQVRNGMIDKRPAVIVRPANAGDVMSAVRFAGDNAMTRRGPRGRPQRPRVRHQRRRGRRRPLRRCASVRVDPLTHTARVAGGATWGDLELGGVRVRAGHDGRHHLHDRGRRADPGRWHRLPRPRARASPWTTCCPPTWSPGTAPSTSRARRTTRTSSGRSAAAAATSVSSRRSSSGSARSRTSTAGRCSSSSTRPVTCCASTASSSPTHPSSSAASRRSRSRRPCRSSPRTGTATGSP